MAGYENTGEQTLVFPTLGLVVNPGETFDAPDDLILDGVSVATGKKASKNATATPVAVDTATEPAPAAAVENTSVISETVADAAVATPSLGE